MTDRQNYADSAELTLRPATDNDFVAICQLNSKVVEHTSPMSRLRLQELKQLACYFQVISLEQQILAFLLACKSGAKYDNANFAWFSQRYSDFIYIDRVVVDDSARGKKLGSMLYRDLFAYATINSAPLITCEYNLIPANHASQQFHQQFGFSEVGRQWLEMPRKQVSMQVAKANFFNIQV